MNHSGVILSRGFSPTWQLSYGALTIAWSRYTNLRIKGAFKQAQVMNLMSTNELYRDSLLAPEVGATLGDDRLRAPGGFVHRVAAGLA